MNAKQPLNDDADALLRKGARARFFEAQEHIQRAQNELDRACSLLFHVANGGSPVERRIWKMREAVHRLWWWLEQFSRTSKFEKLKLDGMVGPRFLEEQSQQAAHDDAEVES